MILTKQELSSLSNNELLYLKKIKEEYDTSSKLSTTEQALKKILNSLYGAISTPSFQWFDLRIASAITLTGQMYIRSVIKSINENMNSKFYNNEKNDDSVVGADTDSSMTCVSDLVKKYYKGENDTHKITDWILKFDNKYLTPLIDKTNRETSDYLNVLNPDVMNMKREVVADKALFLAKKHYVMNMVDKEGVRYYKRKLKIQGLDIVRSDTAEAVKEYLTDVIPKIFYEGEKAVRDYVFEVKEKFKDIPVETVAIPSSVNGVDKYTDENTVYKLGTPKHVRASILYNSVVKRMNLEKDIELIGNGDQIKYLPLVKPNPIVGLEDVIAFTGDELPEFLIDDCEIMKYIDYDELFERSFKKPLRNLTDPLKWQMDIQTSLDDLFG